MLWSSLRVSRCQRTAHAELPREQRVRHHRDHYRTTIVPVISWPWTAQSYWYVPGASNLTAYVPLPVMVLLFAKLGEPTDWTLCGRDPVHVQVTVPPIAMVSTAALLLPLWPLTNSMPGPAVTEPTGPPPPPPPPPPPHPPPPPPHHPRPPDPPPPPPDAGRRLPTTAVGTRTFEPPP